MSMSGGWRLSGAQTERGQSSESGAYLLRCGNGSLGCTDDLQEFTFKLRGEKREGDIEKEGYQRLTFELAMAVEAAPTCPRL
jgi:hypothetical protein